MKLKPLLQKFLFGTFFILNLIFTSHAIAGNIWGMPVPQAPCPAGSVNNSVDNGTCWWGNGSADTGIILYGAGAVFSSSNTEWMFGGFENNYVPTTDHYHMVAHLCQSKTAIKCTIKKSSREVISKDAPLLSSTVALLDQDPHFGNTAAEKIPYAFSMCYTFRDSKGHDFKTTAGRTCEDAVVLPQEPSICSINYSMPLDINMGNIERTDLGTSPASGNSNNITNSIDMNCSSNAKVNYTITFDYSASGFNSDLVSTSNNDVGIVIFYNGNIISPSSSITDSFENGLTSRPLEFQAIRNKNTELKNIATGAFTANAVMIFTEQ